LVSYSIPDYFFKAALCRLALNDLVGVKKAVERYAAAFYTWNGSRESKFVNVREIIFNNVKTNVGN